MYYFFQESQVNNGYIPYVDYTRDYTPPAVPTAGVRDSVGHFGSPQPLGDLDPRYRASFANNPYMRNSGAPPGPQTGGVYVTPSSWASEQSPTSPGQSRYITTQAQGMKPGTLATHVWR